MVTKVQIVGLLLLVCLANAVAGIRARVEKRQADFAGEMEEARERLEELRALSPEQVQEAVGQRIRQNLEESLSSDQIEDLRDRLPSDS